MTYFRADDGEPIHLRILGQGPPLVFLHGWTANHRAWVPYARELSDRHTCYCWDARGHGGHILTTAQSVTVERMAADLRNLVEHFGLDQVVLVGHSMGALTAWEYVRRYGCGRLAGLCLVDQSPRLVTDDAWPLGIYGNFDRARNRDFIGRLEEDFSAAVLRLVGDGNNRRAAREYRANTPEFQRVREYLRALSPQPLIDIWKSLTRADYRDVLPDITVPTLLVHGDESHFYSVEVAEYLRDHIPEASLHVYEGSDHSPHVWQRERFLDDLRAFTAHQLPAAPERRQVP